MSILDNEKLLKLTDETLSWGRDVAELWVGTPYHRQVNVQIKAVEKSLETNDLDKVRALVFDLAQFLEYAEKEYDNGEY